MNKVTFSSSAVRDLENILEWYREIKVPEVGTRLIGEILKKVERLARFPESGRMVPEFHRSNLRELIHPPFRIIYRFDPGRIRIVRIWRSERLLTPP